MTPLLVLLVCGHCSFTGFIGSAFHLWAPGPWFRVNDDLPTFESTLLVFTFCFVVRLLVFALTGVL